MSLSIYPAAVRGLSWPVTKTWNFSTTLSSAPNEYVSTLANTINPVWKWSLLYEFLLDNQTKILPALSPYTDYQYLQGFLLSNMGQYSAFLFDDPMDDAIGMLSVPGAGLATYPSIFKTGMFYRYGSYVLDNSGTPHLQQVIQQGISGSAFPTFNVAGGNTTTGSVIFHDTGVFNGANAQALQLVTDGTYYYSPIQRNFAGQFLEDVTDMNTTNYQLAIWANGVLKASGSDYTILGPGLALPNSSYMGMYIKWASMPTAPITCAAQFYFRVCLESDKQDIDQFLSNVWTIGGNDSKNSEYLNIKSRRPNPL